jgi:hypothetical protein
MGKRNEEKGTPFSGMAVKKGGYDIQHTVYIL